MAFAALAASAPRDVHVITTAVEHPATLEPCAFLARLGVRVTVLPVDGHGVVDRDALRRALDQGARLVSVMHANNEVGTLQPVREIATAAHGRGALVHTDAAQSVGKIDTAGAARHGSAPARARDCRIPRSGRAREGSGGGRVDRQGAGSACGPMARPGCRQNCR